MFFINICVFQIYQSPQICQFYKILLFIIFCIISLYKFTFKFTTSHTLRHSHLGSIPALRYLSGIEPKIKICYINDWFLEFYLCWQWCWSWSIICDGHMISFCLSECCCKPHLMDIHVHVVFLQLVFISCISVFFMF